MTPANEIVTVLANGQTYDGYTAITAERHLDRMSSRVTVELGAKWSTASHARVPLLGGPAVVMIGKDPFLTGYLDDYNPRFDAGSHTTSTTGRSKTCDLLDCTPEIASGQFKGYQLAAIARAVAAPHGIGVVLQTDATQIFPDATLQRGETAFTFLERLGRLAGVLLCDDPMGNLVLTTAGSTRSSGTLVLGQNIISGSATISMAKRFSRYVVKGQRAIGSSAGQSEAAEGDQPADIQTSLQAVALDPAVTRYRPRVTIAEAQLDQAGMQRRANWERNYAAGRGTECTVVVPGFRTQGSDLWAINTLVNVNIPWLQIAQDLLIVGVTMKMDSISGRTTTLRLAPAEGYTPDPGQVRLRKQKGHGQGGDIWGGLIPVS